MLLFTITGITLNHAAQISSNPVITKRAIVLPPAELTALRQNVVEGKRPLPGVVAAWLAGQFPEKNLSGLAEWSATDVYLSLPRPGGDGWISLDLTTGAVEWEKTERGWVSYLNDLHKGRHTGWVWQAFIDVIAVAFLIFTATGLVLLQIHSSKRAATWPAVAFGFALPVILVVFFMHV